MCNINDKKIIDHNYFLFSVKKIKKPFFTIKAQMLLHLHLTCIAPLAQRSKYNSHNIIIKLLNYTIFIFSKHFAGENSTIFLETNFISLLHDFCTTHHMHLPEYSFSQENVELSTSIYTVKCSLLTFETSGK